MDVEFTHGLMEESIKETGMITAWVGKGLDISLMEGNTKESGQKMYHMEKEFIMTRMVLGSKESGRRINLLERGCSVMETEEYTLPIDRNSDKLLFKNSDFYINLFYV